MVYCRNVFFIFCLTFLIYITYLYFFRFSSSMKYGETSIIAVKEKKIILGWTTFFGQPFTTTYLWPCPEMNCEITNDRSLLSKSSAVVFHIGDINWNHLPQQRQSNQYYVLLSHESPLYTSHVKLNQAGPDFFNLSLTYRRDSDLYFPYSAYVKRSTPKLFNDSFFDALIKGKTKLVAWFSSNCRTYSEREKYVAALQKYIPVDVYGTCGNLNCAKEKAEECESMLSRNYKFYLAFENSNCQDYVTEKFISRANNFLIPIVLWKRNYENYAPNMSYISVEDFHSVKDLADYLKYLNDNPKEYMKYLEWHRKYETGSCDVGQEQCGFCKLCQMIDSEKIERRIIPDIAEWWFNGKTCDNSLVNRSIQNNS